VTTLILVRHGLTAVTGRVLSGRLPGYPLDERGRAQAAEVGDRLRAVPLAAIVSSPVERCAATAQAIAAGRGPDGKAAPVTFDDRLAEVDYGEWAGRELRDLAREPLWRVVQATPSAVTFPGGETLRAMAARAVDAVRAGNAAAGPDATWLACTHGDLVKAIVADALGLHLDAYQRIAVAPCSISVIRYGADGSALVSRVNDTGAALDDLVPRQRGRGRGRRRSPGRG
jgi:probable phosphomutase (TIGR03848 family)